MRRLLVGLVIYLSIVGTSAAAILTARYACHLLAYNAILAAEPKHDVEPPRITFAEVSDHFMAIDQQFRFQGIRLHDSFRPFERLVCLVGLIDGPTIILVSLTCGLVGTRWKRSVPVQAH